VIMDGRRETMRCKWTASESRRWAVATFGHGYAADLVANVARGMSEPDPRPQIIADRLRNVCLENRITPDHSNFPGGDFGVGTLFAGNGEIWSFDYAFSARQIFGFAARGSGADHAYGAYFACKRRLPGMPGVVILETVILAANRYDTNCGGLWMGAIDQQGFREICNDEEAH
jgi:hypothetical protein